jgi:hypothetical protein
MSNFRRSFFVARESSLDCSIADSAPLIEACSAVVFSGKSAMVEKRVGCRYVDAVVPCSYRILLWKR